MEVNRVNMEERYTVNETLLQSYRTIFISSQSFLLAVGAIVAGKNPGVLFITAVLSLVMIWFIWFPVVRARHRIVDYYKIYKMLSATDIERLSENEYVHDHILRAKANKLFGITNWRETRIKIDIMIPVLFSLIWIVLFLSELGIELCLCAY